MLRRDGVEIYDIMSFQPSIPGGGGESKLTAQSLKLKKFHMGNKTVRSENLGILKHL